MSKSNGTKVVDVDALIERAKETAADGETTRQQEAVDNSLREENEELKAKVVTLEQKLAESKRASKVIADDPKHVKMIEELLGSELFARHLITGNGELVDLKALSKRLDECQMAASSNGNTSVLPATPPTATVPGQPTASSDTNGSKPKLRKRLKAKAGEFWNPTQPSAS